SAMFPSDCRMSARVAVTFTKFEPEPVLNVRRQPPGMIHRRHPSAVQSWLAGAPGRIRTRDPLLRRHIEGSPHVARCGLMGGLAALIVAGGGAASLSGCDWWLPNWLPELR